jgi:hypothetical protein
VTEAIQKLCGDASLDRYIWEQARRHFSCREEQEDAHSEAWERLCELATPPLPDEARRLAYKAIRARYMRIYRERKHTRKHDCLQA